VAVPTKEEFIAYNGGVIDEFRSDGGKLTEPPFPILSLTTTGARTGERRTVPLGLGLGIGLGVDGARVFIVGSEAGAPSDPDWFHNPRASPSVTVELGSDVFEATVVITAGAERDRLYRIVIGDAPALNADELNTTRISQSPFSMA
jgi:deazaflavin-dependent oxidoreductase (nitroreductase family)